MSLRFAAMGLLAQKPEGGKPGGGSAGQGATRECLCWNGQALRADFSPIDFPCLRVHVALPAMRWFSGRGLRIGRHS